MENNVIGSKGLKIVKIDCSQLDFQISRLSELGENWTIPSECPKCKRQINFSQENINRLFACKCGQNIQLVIPDNLL